MVVGGASRDHSVHTHAFRHNEDDIKMTDLGTLKSDNSGTSEAKAISANVQVVVGRSQTDDGVTHAFKHTDTSGMVDLGTLGGKQSYATGVSDDGSIIVGSSQTVSGVEHAFIYKTKMIDSTDSNVMLHKGAEQQTAALNFLQDKLTDALTQGCRPSSAGNTCFSAGAKYYQQTSKAVDDTAAYINIAHRFQPKFYAGIYVEQSVSSGFADSIDTSNEQPLVSVYGSFNPSENSLGLQIRAAVATHKINADITRPSVANTESGRGSTSFKGYSGQVEAAYVL